MEIWLGTDNNKIRFPVLPSQIGVDREANIESSNILNLGEVTIFNGMSAKTIEISSFFPSKVYPFVAFSDIKKPYEYSQIFQEFMYKGTIVRFIVTGTPTNMLCKISSFSTYEKDGTGDLYFDMTLVEHKDITVPKVASINQDTQIRPAPTPPSTQRTHKVMPNESLWSIAQKYYGKGSLYPKIKEANWDKYPSLKKNNIIYAKKDGGWVLVIP